MKTISRRDALKHGGKTLAIAGAAIATGAAAAAIPAVAKAGGNDARLEALEAEYYAINDASDAIAREFDAAEEWMPKWARGSWPKVDRADPLWQGFEYSGDRPTTLADVRRRNARWEGFAKLYANDVEAWYYPLGIEEYQRRRAEGRARVRSWIARLREQRVLREKSGFYEIDARWEVLADRLTDVTDEIMQTPAAGARGVAVKLRIYKWNVLDMEARGCTRRGDPDLSIYRDVPASFDTPERFAVYALADLERLAGGAS